MALQLNAFSKTETEIIKGLGILLIVLHNVFHNLTPIIGENEFAFRFQYFVNFYRSVLDSPFDSVRAFFSYFGHYGVQLFIFFSAYGLTRKYYSNTIAVFPFLRGRFSKIYVSFLFCVSVYVVLGFLKSYFLTDDKVLYWDSIFFKVLLISNFIPNQALMPVGPWWFIPFIFQFYLLFPFLLKGFQSYGARFLALVSFVGISLQLIAQPFLFDSGVSLYVLILGHLPVLCAAMYSAAQERISLRTEYLWLFALLFFLGNFNQHIWAFCGISFTILALVFSRWMLDSRKLPTFFLTTLSFFGGISFHLFLVNGFLRSPFHSFAEQHNLWSLDILAALASLTFSTIFAVSLRYAEHRLRDALGPLLKNSFSST